MTHSPVFTSIGLPPGVCNMVFGTGPKGGEAIVTHPDVSAISFTGSTATGERIQRVSAPYCKKLSLEVSVCLSEFSVVFGYVRSIFSIGTCPCACTYILYVYKCYYCTFTTVP